MREIIELLYLVYMALIGYQEPILLTGYDYQLGGVNCVEPCNQTALGYWLDEKDYWNGVTGVAACPKQWLGATVLIKGFGSLKCLDTGGAIKRHAYNEYYGVHVTHIDILARKPLKQPWNYSLIDGSNYQLVWP